ncbi:hypothetical protein CHUAL_008479 [Chamberlinius hualienensis]
MKIIVLFYFSIFIIVCWMFRALAADTNGTDGGSESTVGLSSRSYGYGGVGGPPSYAGAMSNTGLFNQGLFFSNFDTALTTLAVLSFGVFLLNMIFSLMDSGLGGGGGGGVILGPPNPIGKRIQKFENEKTKLKTKRSIAALMDVVNSKPHLITSCQLGPLCPHHNNI